MLLTGFFRQGFADEAGGCPHGTDLAPAAGLEEKADEYPDNKGYEHDTGYHLGNPGQIGSGEKQEDPEDAEHPEEDGCFKCFAVHPTGNTPSEGYPGQKFPQKGSSGAIVGAVAFAFARQRQVERKAHADQTDQSEQRIDEG